MEDEVVSVELDKNYTGKSLEQHLPVITENIVDLTVSSTHTLDNAIKVLQDG